MVRIATIDDIDSLIELRIKLLKELTNDIEDYDWNKYSQVLKAFYFEGLSNKTFMTFIAEEDSLAVSTCMMYFYNITPLLYNLDGKMALLTDMYTIPEYRNKGYGMKLLHSIMEFAKNLGYLKVTLNATASGRKLYDKYGFKDVNGEMAYKFQ